MIFSLAFWWMIPQAKFGAPKPSERR